jgi:two-component system CheB/CheR fusion protein
LKKSASPATPVETADDAVATSVFAGHTEYPTAAQASASFCIAGIGASAGGLEAICEFFEAMPADSGIAFVVIQHLYPGQKSLAAEIIGKHTTISAKQAEEGERVEPDHIYTIPPNTYPSLVDGRLHLEQPKNKAGPRLPIDHFFSSLGKDQHQRAIGIVLSGSGSDGSLGLRGIESSGGIVFAQSPDSAQFDSMPRSAIGTGLVHKVLAVADMPAALVGYARHCYVLQPCVVDSVQAAHGELDDILSIIERRRGADFSGFRRFAISRRIWRRMGLRAIDSLADYASLLNSDAAEIDALFKDLLIGGAEFFRDAEAWQALRTLVIVPLVDSAQSGATIRVWVPGCSTGEEAYTIAMLILEQLREAEKRCHLLVFATDSSEEALQFGRLGNYPSGISTQIAADLLGRYFVESASNHHYQVSKTLRSAVVFGQQNLMNDPPFSKVDIICCRNFLDFLEPDIQKRIISLFSFSLRPGACLFVGASESLDEYADLFAPISKQWRIYRQVGSFSPISAQLPMLRPVRSLAVTESHAPPADELLSLRPSQLGRITQQLLLARFSPAAVLANARLETLYFSGPIENYLQVPPGVPSRDFLAQVREGLRSRLRKALREAISSGDTVVVDDARVRRNKGYHPVRISVVPTQHVCMLYLVVFEELAKPAATDAIGNESALVRQLEDELRATRDDLQNSVERLETSNEELKVSHEEVVSVNEELQSINEELESSKEELQSLNEELTTVNLQLQMKVADLETSNSDITNLLASSQIATLCLDRENHIRWFSPSMRKISNIIAGDVGRLITDFSTYGLGENLVEDAASVLDTLVPVQRELMSPDALCYLRRIVPYRSDNDHIGGVVITYTDISEAKRTSQAAVDAQRAMAASLEDRVRERTTQLRMLTAELALTEERERRVLARDLHDDLGQVLAIVKIKLTSLEESERRGALKGPLQEIETLIDQANRSARSLMLQLSPPTLQTLGLLPALEWLGEEMERIYGLAVLIDKEGDLPTLEEPARTTIFRAIRELLINVSKHAETNVAQINCHQSADGQLSISVTDQGLGFDYQHALSNPAKDSGFGLISVRERIEFIGGEMTVDTMPGYGATITIVFPADKNT